MPLTVNEPDRVTEEVVLPSQGHVQGEDVNLVPRRFSDASRADISLENK